MDCFDLNQQHLHYFFCSEYYLNLTYSNVIDKFSKYQDINFKRKVVLNETSQKFILDEFKKFKTYSDRWFKKRKLQFNSDEYEKRFKGDDSSIQIACRSIADDDIDDVQNEAASPFQKRKHFLETTRKQQQRRTEELWKLIQSGAAEEDISVEQLLGFLLTRTQSHSCKHIGNKLLLNSSIDDVITSHVPTITALTIYCDCNLGRQTYTKLKRILSNANFPILPPWSKLRKLQSEITPPVIPYEDKQGLYFPFLRAVQTTVLRIFSDQELHITHNELTLKLKYGFDGSGSHSIYRQKNNAQTNNMILTVFCPLKITSGEEEIW